MVNKAEKNGRENGFVSYGEIQIVSVTYAHEIHTDVSDKPLVNVCTTVTFDIF